MTQYTHRITLAVPELLIPQANQLALIMGESAEDVSTFAVANWQDALGNKYAVCSAVAKPSVLSPLTSGLPDPPPEAYSAHAAGADTQMAQQAFDSRLMYAPADGEVAATQVQPDKILLIIDHDPLSSLSAAGLTRIEEAE